jgi:flagella basal body P-ring formation protein FlgA
MRALLFFLALSVPVQAETLVATRLIRAMTIIGPEDVAPGPSAVVGAAHDPAQVVGLEARVAIYPGRPVRLSELGQAAAIERNDVIQMVYRRGALRIVTEGRALARGAIDDVVPVMNLTSRQTVQGVILSPGLIEVTPDRSR